MPQPLQILLVEDDWSVRSAVRDYLARHDMVVCEADSLEAALAAAAANPPDVAVLDIVLPERPGQRPAFDLHVGVVLARQLRAQLPDLGIVFLSAFTDRGPEVVQIYLDGHDRIVYLLKGSKPQELLDAIRVVSGGLAALKIDPVIPRTRHNAWEQALAALTAEERAIVEEGLARLPSLSEPERRVYAAVGACRTHKQAATELGLSTKTVSNHLDAIYDKLGLRAAQPGLNQLMLLAKIYLVDCLHPVISP